MAKILEKDPTPARPINVTEVERLLQSFGQAVSSVHLYGAQHRVTRRALEDSQNQLEQVLARHSSVSLSVAEGDWLVEGKPLESHNPLIRAVGKQMEEVDIGGFTLNRGITAAEFAAFILLIAGAPAGAKPATGNAKAEALPSNPHVQFQRVTYQRVTQDDTVVNKEVLEQAQAAKDVALYAPVLNQVVAFLHGQAGGAGTLPSEEAKALASDPAQLVELLLKAAEIRPATVPTQDGESLSHLVVGCLRRLHDHVRRSPALKTKQGKKDLAKTLVMMERQVIEKLRALATPEAAAQAAEQINAAVEEMTDDVRMDELVSDFLRKRKLADATEKRLHRFIAARRDKDEYAEDVAALQQRLQEGGLTSTDWATLVAKSTGLSEAGGGQGPAGAPPLSALLLQLVERLDTASGGKDQKTKSDQVAPIVHQLQQGMAASMADARRKVDGLQQHIREVQPLEDHSKPDEVARQAMSRKRIIVMLAEIVQELCQPLAVIIATIEMVCQGQLGTVPDIQKQMLEMALQNGQRIGELVQALASISGMPSTLQPDSRILEQIYRR